MNHPAPSPSAPEPAPEPAIERFVALLDGLCAALIAELTPRTWAGTLFAWLSRPLALQVCAMLRGIRDDMRRLAAEYSAGVPQRTGGPAGDTAGFSGAGEMSRHERRHVYTAPSANRTPPSSAETEGSVPERAASYAGHVDGGAVDAVRRRAAPSGQRRFTARDARRRGSASFPGGISAPTIQTPRPRGGRCIFAAQAGLDHGLPILLRFRTDNPIFTLSSVRAGDAARRAIALFVAVP